MTRREALMAPLLAAFAKEQKESKPKSPWVFLHGDPTQMASALCYDTSMIAIHCETGAVIAESGATKK